MQQQATATGAQPGDVEGQMTAAQAEAIARAVGVAKGPSAPMPEQQLHTNYMGHNNSIPVVQAAPVDETVLRTEETERTSRKKKLQYISLLLCVIMGAAVLVAATVTTLYR